MPTVLVLASPDRAPALIAQVESVTKAPYRHVSKISIRYGMQPAQLKEIRAFDLERQGRWSFSSQQATPSVQT